ncbi:hypothetical protein LJC36_00165 [Desulfovibrio sp. OttesenSCG-928-C14]|nr:hypothetical protein [Desulfovibrio sp. OttesenSCG-928-C14]
MWDKLLSVFSFFSGSSSISWILLAAALALAGVQSCRLNLEEARHQATRHELSGQLALEKTAGELLRQSLEDALAAQKALQKQITDQALGHARQLKAAQERAGIMAGAAITEKQHLKGRVVDDETSSKALKHLNEVLHGGVYGGVD